MQTLKTAPKRSSPLRTDEDVSDYPSSPASTTHYECNSDSKPNAPSYQFENTVFGAPTDEMIYISPRVVCQIVESLSLCSVNSCEPVHANPYSIDVDTKLATHQSNEMTVVSPPGNTALNPTTSQFDFADHSFIRSNKQTQHSTTCNDGSMGSDYTKLIQDSMNDYVNKRTWGNNLVTKFFEIDARYAGKVLGANGARVIEIQRVSGAKISVLKGTVRNGNRKV
ncbi:hypothetical protein HK098_006675 [Nowakowskiella sp. JEL0407]|nr:hypothetical protein HK098_006675 [Nowakowskiella sp. JEL0407]